MVKYCVRHTQGRSIGPFSRCLFRTIIARVLRDLLLPLFRFHIQQLRLSTEPDVIGGCTMQLSRAARDRWYSTWTIIKWLVSVCSFNMQTCTLYVCMAGSTSSSAPASCCKETNRSQAVTGPFLRFLSPTALSTFPRFHGRSCVWGSWVAPNGIFCHTCPQVYVGFLGLRFWIGAAEGSSWVEFGSVSVLLRADRWFLGRLLVFLPPTFLCSGRGYRPSASSDSPCLAVI